MAVNKRKLHHYLTRIKIVRSWVLVLLIIVFMGISVMSLRQNNLRMIELRDQVLAVDEEKGGVDMALRNLGDHVVNHMNTRLAQPVELIHSYNRAAEKIRADSVTTANASIYKKAQQACENPNIPLTARAQCLQDYVLNNAPEGQNPQPLEFPSKDLFTYDFASPKWSPDMAGLSLLAVFVLSIVLTARALAGLIITQVLKSRN